MKNTTELARELATLYGIQFEESVAATQHIVLDTNKTEGHFLTLDDYPDVFGLTSAWTLLSGQADSVKTLRETFDLEALVPSPKYKPDFRHLFEPNLSDTIEYQHSFALAA